MIAVVLLCAATGCHPREERGALAEIDSGSEEGFRDLAFTIRSHHAAPDGGQILDLAGLHRGQQVGLELYLGPAWEGTSPGGDLPIEVHRGTVKYRSLGRQSDRLIQGIDSLYGTGLGVRRMNAETTFTGVSLGGDPRRLADGVVRIKLFFEPGPRELYAELFTNIDLESRTVQVSEKDQEYRAPILRAIADSSGE